MPPKVDKKIFLWKQKDSELVGVYCIHPFGWILQYTLLVGVYCIHPFGMRITNNNYTMYLWFNIFYLSVGVPGVFPSLPSHSSTSFLYTKCKGERVAASNQSFVS